MTKRVVKAQFMPTRPDLDILVRAQGKAKRRSQKGGIYIWPIDVLIKGDVYVADGYGKINRGTLIGATLANSIFNKSGIGVIFNGRARDLEEIQTIESFNAFARAWHPSFLEESNFNGFKYRHPDGQRDGHAGRFSNCET